MLRILCKSKIHRATLTDVNLVAADVGGVIEELTGWRTRGRGHC